MSPSQIRLRDHVVNTLIVALITLFFTVGTGAVSSKETVKDHNADVERILDVLCEMKPNARACSGARASAGSVPQR